MSKISEAVTLAKAETTEGMEQPFYCLSVATNGSMLGCHYVSDSGDGEVCRVVMGHVELDS